MPADYLRNAFRNVVPLSRSAPERIEEVRQLGDRAIPASGRQPSLGVVGAQLRRPPGRAELTRCFDSYGSAAR